MPNKPKKSRPIDRDDLLCCDCAQCSRVIVGESHAMYADAFHMVSVAARINGRPYCPLCVLSSPPPYQSSSRERRASAAPPDAEDNNPWQSIAIRQMEDAGGGQ